ncbi:hypothetical protein EHQ12_07195 [Leptospira gomenensis]|uniref:Uncharacterized protein n=1 Tax=Leptospira gomenensis TaxID=2484974 RepID=A0A5F1YCT0_9LEPT|nr:hypothetical protein [Leptospira gomenensis]TGK35598.1 hypothetical protein EHQ17_06120 [Leptospira gomenensis]TGK40675.1 hypothetical protein EHQ12_07195 [Leptospira gomenensis]TGK46366.1 hypothetical protein EHQ07_06365 [Leptospira gomenensis]TGK65546.1 hypothetical protein EHQ13_05015 [Leptospira gomenensis]
MRGIFLNFELKKRGLRFALFFTLLSLVSFFAGNALFQFLCLSFGVASFVFTLLFPEEFYSLTNWGLEFVLRIFSGIAKGALLLCYLLLWKPIRFFANLFVRKQDP